MNDDPASSIPEYAPGIRHSFTLSDISLKSMEGPFSAADSDKLRFRVQDDKIPSNPSVGAWLPPPMVLDASRIRAKLIDRDEFHANMLAMASGSSGLGTSKGIHFPRDQTPPSNKRPRNLGSTSPLIEALNRAAEHKKALADLASRLEGPPMLSSASTPTKGTFREESSRPLEESPHQAPSDEHKPESKTMSPELPILPDSSVSIKSDNSTNADCSKARFSIIDVFTLSAQAAVRLVRILERIAARKILRAWRRRRAVTAKYREEIKEMKLFLKQVVTASIQTNRQIRSELKSIRDELLKKAVSKIQPPTTHSPPSVPPTPIGPAFKSARVLLGLNVKSPQIMDEILEHLTFGKGPRNVRLCVGQPTVHPRAFVLVVLLDSISIEQWIDRIVNNPLVFAYDKAFPLTQGAIPGVPWEVRIRKDMIDVIPVWIETQRSGIIHNSLS